MEAICTIILNFYGLIHVDTSIFSMTLLIQQPRHRPVFTLSSREIQHYKIHECKQSK